jgi:hypothetical protein
MNGEPLYMVQPLTAHPGNSEPVARCARCKGLFAAFGELCPTCRRYRETALRIVAALPAPERWWDGGPDHSCTDSPQCSAWKDGAPDGPECDHGSCLAYVFESCATCYEMAMEMPDVIRCGQHGDQRVADSGHNSGFAGEGLWWVTLDCGCSQVEEGSYTDF